MMTVTVRTTNCRPTLWHRVLRLPRFGTAFSCSVIALLGFVLWTFVDAAFDDMLCIYGIITHANSLYPWVPTSVAWKVAMQLGWIRMALFVALSGIAVVHGSTALLRLFFGKRGGRSIVACLLVTALVGGWLGFYLAYDRLLWSSYRFRVQQRLPELSVAARDLALDWPTSSGTLPVVGEFSPIDHVLPNCLALTDSGAPFPRLNERICGPIRRTENGAIQIGIDAAYPRRRGEFTYQVEFMPPGHVPASFKVRYTDELSLSGLCPNVSRYALEGYVSLGDNAYLAWYSPNSYYEQ